uniref:Uncharacterized protein n=1 Tax=Arundo donax TaxID=35708 RepID=A0A0A9CEW4_ARUDO
MYTDSPSCRFVPPLPSVRYCTGAPCSTDGPGGRRGRSPGGEGSVLEPQWR